ncbi:hypothetical protein PC9H_001038 [Pleurotus ostreatus]|uniref:Sulphur transport domain-containing protein n=1 Tax=Pleurotus ostreatus TaxID=5322 RepID=A0A8H7DZW3_PLEOS|nr:uncharacterized protein PC9H_001038 [Pleurotus ostreatus]KAF7440691.1 hypothetical protein PC9H_001038 [Pleurotus ostreatus]KAJ8699916.1 hypothetical protein PTI98_002992 [Pleurotus ostreatus]
MSKPTPLRSFIGGVGLSLPVHSLFVFNGSNFGVSGFIHNAVAGGTEGAAGVVGLVLGGFLIGLLEGRPPAAVPGSLSQIALAGLLVGIGTKLSNGCTSGHMLCGLSRLSTRSLAATLSFFISGAATTLLIHGSNLPSNSDFDWTVGDHGMRLLSLKAFCILISTILHTVPWERYDGSSHTDTESSTRETFSLSTKRRLITFFTGLDFAVALHVSNLTDATRVLRFLVLPFHRAFDPSLAFLALGALPPAIYMYHTHRGSARLGKLPGTIATKIDSRLIGGAALFGVGWGLCGICPAPGLVNLGRAIVNRADATQFGLWLLGVVIGGRVAKS